MQLVHANRRVRRKDRPLIMWCIVQRYYTVYNPNPFSSVKKKMGLAQSYCSTEDMATLSVRLDELERRLAARATSFEEQREPPRTSTTTSNDGWEQVSSNKPSSTSSSTAPQQRRSFFPELKKELDRRRQSISPPSDTN
jgi:hypothetical protein